MKHLTNGAGNMVVISFGISNSYTLAESSTSWRHPTEIPSVCTRYALHRADAAMAEVADALGRDYQRPDWIEDRYNIRISEAAPIFTISEGTIVLARATFGLIPPFSRRVTKPARLHNARSETVTTLPSFRDAVRHRRCLIPANGYYESVTMGGISHPFFFTLKEEQPFAIAGIWQPGDEDGPTFSMLTTAPNPMVALIHDRMPVVLTKNGMKRWIGERPLKTAELSDLCRALPSDAMQFREVNRQGNKPRIDGPICIAPPDNPRQIDLSLH
jgi:putative SOS response-associated peptidase YedK